MSPKILKVIFCASLCLLGIMSSESIIVSKLDSLRFDSSLKKLEKCFKNTIFALNTDLIKVMNSESPDMLDQKFSVQKIYNKSQLTDPNLIKAMNSESPDMLDQNFSLDTLNN